jgi:dienelactone hydrolase
VGLTPFFKDVCERLAAEGFVAFAPDRYGGPTAATIEEAEALQRQREDQVRTEAALVASVEFLSAHEAVVGEELGALGFSAGAAWALLLSVRKPDLLRAVIAFYGTGLRLQSEHSKARAAYLGHYAELDEWEPVDEVLGTQEALRAAGCLALVLRGRPPRPLRRSGSSFRLGANGRVPARTPWSELVLASMHSSTKAGFPLRGVPFALIHLTS